MRTHGGETSCHRSHVIRDLSSRPLVYVEAEQAFDGKYTRPGPRERMVTHSLARQVSMEGFEGKGRIELDAART